MGAKLACLILCLAWLALVTLAAPEPAERDQCFRQATAYLVSDISLEDGNGPTWTHIVEKSREFYPDADELLLTTSPKEGYVDQMLQVGILYGYDKIDNYCKTILTRVDELPDEVPCFDVQEGDESPLESLRQLMKESTGVKPIIERYLICHYVANLI